MIAFVGFFNKANDWKSEESKRIVVNHFAQFLELTPEQKQQIEPIIREGLDRRWQMRNEYREQTDLMFVEEFMPRLHEFLTTEQRQRLKDRLLQWRKDNKIAGTAAALQSTDENGELNSAKDHDADSGDQPPASDPPND